MTDKPFKSLDIPSQAETQALGRKLAMILRAGDVVALQGTLGMGKSALARAILRARAGDDDLAVPSPTFTIVQSYDLDPAFYHVDLYRLEDPEEALELGLEEAFHNAVTLIEWPENLGRYLPQKALSLHLTESPVGGRIIAVSGPAPWPERLSELA